MTRDETIRHGNAIINLIMGYAEENLLTPIELAVITTSIAKSMVEVSGDNINQILADLAEKPEADKGKSG